MRYYDHRSVSCDGCKYDQPGQYPDGKAYRACRWFGYIFHEWKGVSPEECLSRKDPEEPERKVVRSMRDLSKRK